MRRRVVLRIDMAPVPNPRQRFQAMVPAGEAIKAMVFQAISEAGLDFRDFDTPDAYAMAMEDTPEIWKRLRRRLVKETRAMPFFGKSKPGENPTADERAEALTKAIQREWLQSREPTFSGPVGLKITAFNPRPASRTKKAGDNPREWDVRHNGDWDNVGKLASDALNGHAYEDDRAVVVGSSLKVMCAANEPPHLLIDIRELPPVEEIVR